VPKRVVTTDGQVLFTGNEITEGQGVWQSIGGQEIGTVWGHGAYVAPDWTADWLHRESLYTLDTWARQQGASSFSALSDERKAALDAKLRDSLRRIQNGEFAREWIMEDQTGRPVLGAMRAAAEAHPLEQVGRRLRGMMSWLKPR
jgi:nitric oxide reductase large subunit